MYGPYEAIKLNDHVWWVGAIDWTLRDFHGYSTELGSTYNAYLILDDHCTLIDTVKKPFFDEMMARISSVIDPSEIEYIVCNHAEMDHSGSLLKAIEVMNPEKIFASTAGIKALQNHYPLTREITGVKDGDIVSLGKRKLQFFETKMIHWPESMFTFLIEDEILFSNDGFGMHIASSQRFDDQLDMSTLQYQAAKYYANILLPYSTLINKLMEKIANLGLSFKMIAPDHGPVWRSSVNNILDWYTRWSQRELADKAVVIYDTMWESTAIMARAITEGLSIGGLETSLLSLQACNRSDIATRIMESKALIVGSPTLNNNLFPTIADVLTYLKGLRPTKLLAGSFGSYGWSGEAVNKINEYFREMKLHLIGEGIKALYVPNDTVLHNCHDYGRQIAELSKAISNE